jgi:error-prone DNA polymerase
MFLNCKTYFSLRYGTFTTKELVHAGVEAGAESLAITNINSTTDAWDFADFCVQAGIRPILGTEIRNDHKFCYILLARNNEGYFQINRFLSQHLIAREDFPDRPADLQDVWIIYALGSVEPDQLEENELIGVQITEINKLYGMNISRWPAKFVIRHPVTFQDDERYKLHRILRAVDLNILGGKLTPEDCAGEHETFQSLANLLIAFHRQPTILTATFQLLESCTITLDFHTDKNKKVYSSSKKNDLKLLRRHTMEGLIYRYGNDNQEALARVEKELKIIDQLNFASYFLITLDFIHESQRLGYYHVGRGSGANSIVAYCLKITDVDPIELDLYFERFLNPGRTSPPDFDIDYSWKDRDEMMAYIFDRYGEDHVALLGMISTFQERAPIREFAKVYGLPESEIEALSEGRVNYKDKSHNQIIKYSAMVLNWPNQLSIHPCGMLISEKPIHYYAACTMLEKPMPVTQMDMFVAEKIGLFKFDILSQRGLGHIRDTFELVSKDREIDIHNIQAFKKDPIINENLVKGNSIGCFYIESPSMRGVLRKLGCDNYLTLVAASSIIRPGVGSSGMMYQYIWRSHHPGEFEYLHPIMEELLKETYGVMVYQEDVIKVGHYFGGLSLEDADILRRAMSGKYRGNAEMLRIQSTFIANCQQKGYPEAVYLEVWRQMASFAGYSFSKAHSASFAVESYQSLYLKTYFPVEFMVSVINNFGGFYTRELYFQQLKKIGVHIHRPCVNISEELTIIHKRMVYPGLGLVKGLRSKTMAIILEQRNLNGLFSDLEDFMKRTGILSTQLELLIDVGAFDFTGRTKKQLLWDACLLIASAQNYNASRLLLFETDRTEYKLPALLDNRIDDLYSDIVNLRFTTDDIFNLVDIDLSEYLLSSELKDHIGKKVQCLGYLICIKHTYTKKVKRSMYFGTWQDAEGEWLDSIHFPNSAAKYPFKKSGFYRLIGMVTIEFGVISLNVTEMYKVGVKSALNREIIIEGKPWQETDVIEDKTDI